MAAMMALTAIATTRVAQAQEQRVAVNIPFDFVVGNMQLPAGEYVVSASAETRGLILISAKASTTSVFVNTYPTTANAPQTESKLVFNRYGDRYFLSQVWREGASQGREITKSAREKEVAQSAALETEGQVTLVAGLATTTR